MKNRLALSSAIAVLAFGSLAATSCTGTRPMQASGSATAPRPVQSTPATAVHQPIPASHSQPRPAMAIQNTGSVIHANAANFDAIINQPGAVVLVDFAAAWCAPCRDMEPTVQQMASEFAGTNAIIARLDVDESSAIADRYGVQTLPTMIYFKNGQPQHTQVGPASAQQIGAQLNQLRR